MDKEIVKRMKEIEKVVMTLDPSVRAEAFAMMRGYILAGDGSADRDAVLDDEPTKKLATRGGTAFLKKHESERDHENVLAVSAWWYSQYGNTPFDPTKDFRTIADGAGLTVPIRIDMTVRQLKRDEKSLFRKTATGYAPTPHGERYLKKTFSVTKGTGAPPPEEP